MIGLWWDPWTGLLCCPSKERALVGSEIKTGGTETSVDFDGLFMDVE